MSQLSASAYSYHVLAASLHPCTSFHALFNFMSFVSLGTDACFLLWAALVAALPSSRFHVCTWRERCQNKAVLLNMPELWCPDISWLTLGSQKLLLASCGSWPQWVRFVPAQVDLLGSLLCCCGYIAVWTVSVWTQNLYLSSHSKCWLHLVSSDDPVISMGNKV